jgi:hypothetical protein
VRCNDYIELFFWTNSLSYWVLFYIQKMIGYMISTRAESLLCIGKKRSTYVGEGVRRIAGTAIRSVEDA